MATAKNANTPRRQSLGEYIKGVRKEMSKVQNVRVRKKHTFTIGGRRP